MSQEEQIARGREVELRHQEILDAWVKAQSPERVRELMGSVVALRRDYTTRELAELGIRIPADLNPTRPEHAIVLAVRNDLADTERRMDQALQQQKWQSTKAATGLEFGAGGGGGKDLWDKLNELLGRIGTVGKLAIAGVVLWIAWDFWRGRK